MDASSNDAFTIVGAGYRAHQPAIRKKGFWARLKGKPTLSVAVFSVIALGCLFSNLIINHDPAELFLMNVNEAPNAEFWFGTDSLGRDIYSIIWYGGRASIFIGLMRAAVIPLIGLVIGVTGWFALSRIVRSEVRQIRNSEYILASRCMGARFPFIMRKHLIPNFVSAIMFVVISSISTSMAMEATLSFLGLGLPVDVLSWGSMLALADRALLLNSWWVILIPGVFLVVTLLSITSIGHYFRKRSNQGPSNL